MEIETDHEIVESPSDLRAPRKLRVCPECSAAFMPRYGSQVCCSDNCKSIRQQRLERERQQRLERERADRNLKAARIKAEAKRKVEGRRAREFRQRRRDLEWSALHTPVKVEVRDGVRIETRGRCAWGGLTGKAAVPAAG